MIGDDTLEKASYDNIPDELKALRQWVCYRIEERNGAPTKIPYRTDRAGRGNAKSNDPSTWHTFDEVVEAAAKPANRFDGIGFVLSKSDPYVFIDMDHEVTETYEFVTAGACAITVLRLISASVSVLVAGGRG